MKCPTILAFCLGLTLYGPAALAQTKPPKLTPRPPPAGPALKTYHGEYEGGTADYTYYLDAEGQRIRHGRFESVENAKGHSLIMGWRVISTDYTETRQTGNYTDGTGTGRWKTTVTEYYLPGNRPNRLLTDLSRCRTTTTTYDAEGNANGPVSYADVPWRGGRPGPATTRANARRCTRPEHITVVVPRRSMFDPSVDDAHPLTEREKQGLDNEADATKLVTTYAAGSYRYSGEADISDPAHRPQTARGQFDTQGFCDSTWTLNYWKSSSELDDATRVQRAEGWMTSTPNFDHGVLLRETTEQASTGKRIHAFALLEAAAPDSAERLVFLREPAPFIEWANPNAHSGEVTWSSPIPETDDASHFFFYTATRCLGAPLLANTYPHLVPTANDSAVVRLAEAVFRETQSQWPNLEPDMKYLTLPDEFGAHPPVAVLHAELQRLLTAPEVESYRADANTDALRHFLIYPDYTRYGKRTNNPNPWLAEISRMQPQESVVKLRRRENMLGQHLVAIQLRTGQLQELLAAADTTIPTKP